MKAQRMNMNRVNPMQLNTMGSSMEMLNLLQKIGKDGKRKFSVSLDRNMKKFLGKLMEELKKQFIATPGAPNVVKFIDYVIGNCNSKEKLTELKLSYEELEFMKKILSEAVRGIENTQFKWYQFIRKGMSKMMLKQYKDILTKIKK